MSDAMIGWAYVVMTLIVLFGMRSISFVRRFGKRNAGILLFGMAGISCSILAITTNSIISVLSILCIRIAFTMITPLSQTIQHNLVSHKNRATAISVNAVIMDGVAVATSMAFGKASDVDLPFAFGIGVVFCVVGLSLFLWAMKKIE